MSHSCRNAVLRPTVSASVVRLVVLLVMYDFVVVVLLFVFELIIIILIVIVIIRIIIITRALRELRPLPRVIWMSS